MYRELNFGEIAANERKKHSDIMRRTREINKLLKKGLSKEEATFRIDNPNWRLERKAAKEAERLRKRQERKTKSSTDRHLPEKLRNRVLDRDNHKCTKCGSVDTLHIHHVIYRSNGGSDEPDNLTTLCEECHIKQHEGEPVFFLMMKNREERLSE